MTAVLQESTAGSVRWLRLNRPERRNALDDRLVGALERTIDEAADDPAVDVVVLAGNGPAFCAGADLKHLLAIADEPGEPTAFLSRVSALTTQIERMPKPVVAALHGHVVAGGLELALACDLVIAAEQTQIGDGHLRNRLLPAAGSSVRLPRRLGASWARRLLLTGELVPAEELMASGWIIRVVPAPSLQEAATDVAHTLAAVGGPAQRNMKALLGELESLTPAQGLEHELRRFANNWTAADVPAALDAFLQERAGPGRTAA